MSDVTMKLIHVLDLYLRQDETAGDTDNGVYRQGQQAMAAALTSEAAEPVAWWRVSYIDPEGHSDADVQIGKNKPTPQLLADNGFPWEPLYGSPLAAVTSAPAETATSDIDALTWPDKGSGWWNRAAMLAHNYAEVLADIAGTTNRTATPKQFAEHLQRTARRALELGGATPAPAETPPAAGAIDAREQEAPNAGDVLDEFEAEHNGFYLEPAEYTEWFNKLRTALASRSEAPAAPSAEGPKVDMVPPATSRDRWMYEQGRLAERDPRTPNTRAAWIEECCARIKAADDAKADGDYMLDSDDCIAVLRGTWTAPLANDCPPAPIPATGESHE